MIDGSNRVKTDIDAVDDFIGGGIPPGALVTISTESRIQTELFLHQMLSGSNALYLSTVANEEAVQAELQKSPINVSSPKIVHVSPSSPLQEMRQTIENVPEAELIVVNSINELESENHVNYGAYQKFLNWLQNRCRRTEGVVVFSRYQDGTPLTRKHLTNKMSDIIVEFEEHIDGESVTNYIHIPKCRSSQQPIYREKIELRDRVTIDTTRDIA